MAINLLVVDDSGVMRAMILKTMRMAGLELAEIHEAANGQEGLDLLENHWIDLAVVDINMPVMNGEEMIDRMNENPEMCAIPVVVISTEGSKARIESLQHKGATFIHKPFSAETIRDTVKHLLRMEDDDGRADP
ncbi:MAG: response regulator [Deltaproteobacteria bacterium]|nr:response regulator [Deltaproteobacteria bacterium]